MTTYYPNRAAVQRGVAAAQAAQDEFRQLFERFFQVGEDADASSVVTSQWIPPVDIREDATGFTILADLPGIDPNAVEILMDKGILSIKGERKERAAARASVSAAASAATAPSTAASRCPTAPTPTASPPAARTGCSRSASPSGRRPPRGGSRSAARARPAEAACTGA